MNKSFLRKAIGMLRYIRIGNMVLFIDRSPFKFKGYGIGVYKRGIVINIWEFTLFLIFDDRYFIA